MSVSILATRVLDRRRDQIVHGLLLFLHLCLYL
jgi:hypothetical protein